MIWLLLIVGVYVAAGLTWAGALLRNKAMLMAGASLLAVIVAVAAVSML